MPQGTPKKIAKLTTTKLAEGMFGGYMKLVQFEEELDIASALETTEKFPIGSIPIFGVARVKTILAGNSIANFNVGITGNTNKFTAANGTILVAAGSTGGGMSEDFAVVSSAAKGLLITGDQIPTSGKVVFQGAYLEAVAPVRTAKK